MVLKNFQAPARRDGNSYPIDKRRPRRIGFPARVGRSTAWTWAHGMRHALITSRSLDVFPHERRYLHTLPPTVYLDLGDLDCHDTCKNLYFFVAFPCSVLTIRSEWEKERRPRVA